MRELDERGYDFTVGLFTFSGYTSLAVAVFHRAECAVVRVLEQAGVRTNERRVGF
jgi:hypothetical protein